MNNNSIENNKKLAIEWILRAQDDEVNAAGILKERNGTPMHICFVSQQIGEKYLKALLLFYSGDYPKIHNLSALVVSIGAHDNLVSEELIDAVVALDPYYIEARYPADIPIESFTWQMAIEAFEFAMKIKNFVLERIK
jgi:HEPN domain-containing protein